MMAKPKSYEEAYNELQEIERALEHHALPIDQLSKKVKRAGELLIFCRENLRRIDAELQDIFDDQAEE